MPAPALVGEFALEQMRGGRGELDDLDAALDVALGIREGLAVFGGEQGGELIHVLVDQVHELDQDAPRRCGFVAPHSAWAFSARRDHVLDFLARWPAEAGPGRAGPGVIDVAESPGGPADSRTANVMGKFAHHG